MIIIYIIVLGYLLFIQTNSDKDDIFITLF